MQLPFRNPALQPQRSRSPSETAWVARETRTHDGLRFSATTTAGRAARAPARNKLVVLAGVANALGRPPRSRLLAERSRRQRTPVRR